MTDNNIAMPPSEDERGEYMAWGGEQTEHNIREQLRRLVGERSQKDVAAYLGISPSYLCDILKGRRDVSAGVVRKMGYRRVVIFVRKED